MQVRKGKKTNKKQKTEIRIVECEMPIELQPKCQSQSQLLLVLLLNGTETSAEGAPKGVSLLGALMESMLASAVTAPIKYGIPAVISITRQLVSGTANRTSSIRRGLTLIKEALRGKQRNSKSRQDRFVLC